MDHLDSQPASINDLETAVLARNYDSAELLIVKLIKLYGKDKVALTLAPFDRKLTKEQTELESFQVIEKMASTLTVWFSDPNWSPSASFFSYIAMQKNFLSNVFAASSYHSTDHIVRNLGLLGKSNYTPEEIRRILLVLTIESDIELPWGTLLEHLPNETAQTFIGLVASIGIQLSSRANKNIDILLKTVSHLPTLETNKIQNLGPIIKAYFNCSGLANEHKYELKKWVSKCLKHYLNSHLPQPLQKKIKKDVKKKPFLKEQTVLFVHELYSSNHAMYRCWHYLFKSIDQNYNTVALGTTLDATTQQEFDEYIKLDDHWDIEKAIETILAVRPDVIIYPSLGMSVYAPFLAQLRLAPIQIACGGHPSSTYSEQMDYFVWEDRIEEKYIKEILVEKYLPYPPKYTPVTLVDYQLNNKVTMDEDETHIVINGVIQKVSKELIDMCNELTTQSSKAVRFHFFMASPKQDLEYFATKSMLRRFLPNSNVHPFDSYSNYMSILAKCKFGIATFPFGGSNSNIDLMRLGIPKLFTLDTNDLPGFADLQLWDSVGVLDGYCDSIEALKTKALEWIDNDESVAKVADKIKSDDVQDLINSSHSEDNSDDRLFELIKGLM